MEGQFLFSQSPEIRAPLGASADPRLPGGERRALAALGVPEGRRPHAGVPRPLVAVAARSRAELGCCAQAAT